LSYLNFILIFSYPGKRIIMKNVFFTAILLASLSPAFANPFISEWMVNPDGGDTGFEFIELRLDSGTNITTDTYVIAIEGDSGQGVVDQIFNISNLAVGTNGYLVLLQNGGGISYTIDSNAAALESPTTGWGDISSRTNDLENGSTSLLIISSPVPPVQDEDVDSDGDGVLDGGTSGNWTIIDGIGNLDGGGSDTAYGLINFSNDGDGISGNPIVDMTPFNGGFTPDYWTRKPGSTGSAASDWVAGDVVGTGPNFTIEAASNTNSPTADNYNINGGTIGASNASVPVELSAFDVE
jgi:hypothetical protein